MELGCACMCRPAIATCRTDTSMLVTHTPYQGGSSSIAGAAGNNLQHAANMQPLQRLHTLFFSRPPLFEGEQRYPKAHLEPLNRAFWHLLIFEKKSPLPQIVVQLISRALKKLSSLTPFTSCGLLAADDERCTF